MNYEPTLLAARDHRITLQFHSTEEAMAWRFRCYNFIRRKAPHFQGTIISLKGNELEVWTPKEPYIKEIS